MSSPADSLSDTQSISALARRSKKLIVAGVAISLLLLACVGCVAFVAWREDQVIKKSLNDQAFSEFVTDYDSSTDFVMPQVNTIQFLRRGFSISFDRVDYTPSGLVLDGTVGNPTQLWISSLALNFTARPYPFQIKEKWTRDSFPFWNTDWDIGSGQTTVGLLNPGTTAPFSVTVPNVKQTSNGIEIAVSFSGERYSYLK